MTSLVNIFHRDLLDSKELSRCAREFGVWKKRIDSEFCKQEYRDPTDTKLLSRCCGRERARLFRGASSKTRLHFAVSYRLRNSIFSRFVQLLKCISANVHLEGYVFSALEMFRIAFVDDVREQRRNGLPPSKRWLVDYVVNEVECLVTNTFDQALYGPVPAFHSVDRVRALFTRTVISPTNVSLLIVPNVAMMCDEITRRRVSFYREHLRKSRKVRILTNRLSPSRMIPPTSPMPDTSDGVGSMT